VDVVLGDYTFKHKIIADLASGTQKLKLIQQPSVGYQHIDVEACTAKGIRIANTAGTNTISVAEHTIAWGLCLLKNMLR
jgi:lactate dehydrogenase-like 2-hydroxyacid dehydrogenase